MRYYIVSANEHFEMFTDLSSAIAYYLAEIGVDILKNLEIISHIENELDIFNTYEGTNGYIVGYDSGRVAVEIYEALCD